MDNEAIENTTDAPMTGAETVRDITQKADQAVDQQQAATSASTGTEKGEPPVPGLLEQMLPILLIWGVFFYFFFIRPDRKKRKEHQSVLDTMKSGDRVVTAGGIHGVVTKVTPEMISVRVDEKNGTCLTFSRAAIIRVIDKDAKKSD